MIRIRLTEMLAQRRLSIVELSDRTGISVRNLEVLRDQDAVAIRLRTLDALCRALKCQPHDLLEWTEATPE
ncbi:helix-turn-helix domain-containing protein [Asticcacaulis machinosus]|uniref:Helix-turn-helix domain-containing protein n=1 Tax=Asticcacaulis machinosus TaxID=2984211 RepID=A0ABT5HKB2_9CAUL|nr:helix-turn-helix domain-containing protein [Asticcacaulis machinosus]MDC7676667.1 helix-turn-helix domain-containing protein [Asticcacaulis machinosus]